MNTTEILNQIKSNGQIDEVWLSISLAKLKSLIHAKVGTNLLEQEAINPSMVREMLEVSLNEISEVLINRLQKRN
ncbi:MAG: hypothetical protein RL204_438 [Bacteroidota bacterium]|jgi:hypothetical protein